MHVLFGNWLCKITSALGPTIGLAAEPIIKFRDSHKLLFGISGDANSKNYFNPKALEAYVIVNIGTMNL